MSGCLCEGRQAPGLIAQQLMGFISFSNIFQSIFCSRVHPPCLGAAEGPQMVWFWERTMDQFHLNWEGFACSDTAVGGGEVFEVR